MSYRKYTTEEREAYRAGKAAAAKAAPRKKTPTRRAPAKRAPARKKDDYYTDGEIGEIVGGGIGAAIGGGPGALIGGAIGRGAHKMMKALTGFGDYHVMGNSLLTGGMSPPEIVNSSNKGGFIVRHREYLGDINATTAFTVHPYYINPGVANTFPWLSQIAGSFEQYRLRGSVFEFKSLSSDAVLSSATSSALGAVIMATDYNVLGGTFPDKMQMENYQYANSSKPSISFLHPIECKRSMTPVTELYVRTGPVPDNADDRLYDLGLFQIATTGMQADSGVAGELWHTYEIELLKPKINPAEAEPLLIDHFTFFGTVDGTTPLGNVTDDGRKAGSTLGGSLAFATNTYAFPAGLTKNERFMVCYQNVGNAFHAYSIPTMTATGCTIENFYDGGATSIAFAPTSGAGAADNAKFVMNFVVVIDADTLAVGDANILFGNSGTTTTLPNGFACRDLIVTRIPQDLA